MDKATLVKSDFEILGRVLLALSRARIPVTLCDWNYVPQIDEWQLIVATPLYDRKGPHEAYSRVVSALQNDDIYGEVPIRRLFVKSPDDPQVKVLEQEMRTSTEGVLFLNQHQQGSRTAFSAVFAPFAGPGGAVPAKHFGNEQDLREFLENDLRIPRSRVDEAVAELAHRAHTWISSVQLTKRNIKRLGLG